MGPVREKHDAHRQRDLHPKPAAGKRGLSYSHQDERL